VCFSPSFFFSSLSLYPIFGMTLGRLTVLLGNLNWMQSEFLRVFPGSYDVIFISSVVTVTVLIIDYCKFGCILLVTL
jgi:hypothetical protein